MSGKEVEGNERRNGKTENKEEKLKGREKVGEIKKEEKKEE